MQNNKHDHWRIPLSSGIGAFIGSWASYIYSPSIWVTALALVVGAIVGWLIGFGLYNPKEVWQKLLAIPKNFTFISIEKISQPKLRQSRIEDWIWTFLCVSLLGPPIIFGVVSKSAGFGASFLVLTIIGFVSCIILFNEYSLNINSRTGEQRYHIFQEHFYYDCFTDPIPNKYVAIVVLGVFWNFIAGMCKGLLYIFSWIIALILFIVLAILLWIYQLIKILNNEQRVAAGFGGLVGAVAGFLFKAPHLGFLIGAFAGWFGYYVLNKLPGVSIPEFAWQKIVIKIPFWLKNVIRTHLPPDAIPTFK